MSASILLISGSVRAGSVSSAVITTVADLVSPELSAIAYTGIAGLPHFNPDLDVDPPPPAAQELREAIANASALLFSTPEYAGAMPGALKNLLEWTVGGAEINDKPTGWINPSTSALRAVNAYGSLRTVLEYTGAVLVDDACVDIPVSRAVIGEDGLIHDSAIRLGISRATSALVDSLG